MERMASGHKERLLKTWNAHRPKELIPIVYEKLYRYLVAESLAMKSPVILEKNVPLVKAFDIADKEAETSKLEIDKSFTRLQTRII